MLIRQNQLGWDYFVDPWNIFDYTLVVLNCADIVVSILSKGSGGLKLASTFRVFRLLRVVQNIKGLKMFFGLWVTIRGLLDSLRTLGWVALFLFIVVYCVAVALTTLKGYNDLLMERWWYANQYVGTVYRSMWTVLQVITLDAWATDIIRPLSEISPIAVCLLFVTLIFCTFGVLNIIIAVMVESIHTRVQHSQNKANNALVQTEEWLLNSLVEEFCEADLDGNGELDLDEFRRMLRNDSLRRKLRLLNVVCDEAEELFQAMDADKSGSISPEEFVAGLKKLKGLAKGQDLVQLICFTQKQCLKASKFLEHLVEMNHKADVILDRLNGIGTGLTHEIRNRKHATTRNKHVWHTAAERQLVINKLDKNRQLKYPSLEKTCPNKWSPTENNLG